MSMQNNTTVSEAIELVLRKVVALDESIDEHIFINEHVLMCDAWNTHIHISCKERGRTLPMHNNLHMNKINRKMSAENVGSALMSMLLFKSQRNP